jgi:hypothetical protein
MSSEFSVNWKYKEAALNGRLFFSYCAARATSVPATAQIGNIIYNPPGSGVNLIMLEWNAQIQVISATTLGLTFGVSQQNSRPTTVTAADASGCTLLNPPTFTKGMAEAFAIATIVTAPTPVHLLLHNTATILTEGVEEVKGDFEGMYIIPPGNVAAISAITAAVATAGMTSTLTWEEAPISE